MMQQQRRGKNVALITPFKMVKIKQVEKLFTLTPLYDDESRQCHQNTLYTFVITHYCYIAIIFKNLLTKLTKNPIKHTKYKQKYIINRKNRDSKNYIMG